MSLIQRRRRARRHDRPGLVRTWLRRSNAHGVRGAVDTAHEGVNDADALHIPRLVTNLDADQWTIRLVQAITTGQAALADHSARTWIHRRPPQCHTRVAAALGELLATIVAPIGEDSTPAETPSSEEADPFSFTVRDRTAGIAFRPWTNGHAIGFRWLPQDSTKPQFLYLVPSTGWTGSTGMVCVHRGTTGDPGRDPIVHRDALTPATGIARLPDDTEDPSAA